MRNIYRNSLLIIITDVFLEKYYIQRNATIANYYFNNTEISFEDLSQM